MTTITSRAQVRVTQGRHSIALAPPGRPRSDEAVFVNAPRSPDIVDLVVGDFSFWVTVEGLTNAFEAEWTEPDGDITLWLHEDLDGIEWIVFNLDVKDEAEADAQMRIAAADIRTLLADICAVRLLAGLAVRSVDRETDWSWTPPRREGGLQ